MFDRFLDVYPMSSVLQDPVPCLFPVRGSRKAWESLPEKKRLLQMAEEYRKQPYPMLTATQFMAFVREGSRKAYENPYFFRRKKLISAFLAACLTGEDSWTDDMVDGIWCICEESSWVLSAHNTGVVTGGSRPLPDVEQPFLDLFSGQTAMILSFIFAISGDLLDQVTPLLRRRVRKEIMERVIQPFMSHDDFWWTGVYEKERCNNWNPWIISNVMLTAGVWIHDRAFLAECLDRACRLLDHYLDVMPEDGGCDEGAAYWNMAGGAVLDCLQFLEHATDGRMCFWENQKLRNIVTFPLKAQLENGWFVNFADCDARPYISGERLQYAGERLGDRNLELCGAALRREAGWQLSDTPQLWRLLNELFHGKPEPVQERPVRANRDVWLPDLQVRVLEHDGLILAAKGGHNAESHNHNDVGTFILSVDGEPEILDAGNMVYTAKTFSSERYTLWNTRSMYHNVPIIGGTEQSEGRSFAAKEVQCLPDGMEMDMAKAYAASAGVEKCRRILHLEKNGLILRDAVCCRENQPVIWVFMLRHEPEIQGSVIRIGSLVMHIPEALNIRMEEIPVTDARMAASYPGSLWRLICEAAPHREHQVCFIFEKQTERANGLL